MTKFTSLTAGAIVALLVICLSSATFADLPTAGLGSLLPSGTPSPTGTEGSDATDSPSASTPSVTPSASTLPNGGSYTTYPSGSPLPSGSSPPPSGSLIPGWASISAGQYGSQSASLTYASPTPSTGGKASAYPNGASKIENGLIGGVIIAGIVSLFF